MPRSALEVFAPFVEQLLDAHVARNKSVLQSSRPIQY
jgi:hypothetical protein